MSTNPNPARNHAAERHASLSRRHFLRGLGAGIALPTFVSLTPGALPLLSAAAPLATTATGAALRTAFVFFPNGAIPSAWWPKEAGDAPQFGTTLQPLEAHTKRLQILGGLDHRAAEPGPDGGGDHARGNGVFLTGVRLKKSATDIHAGISIDQVMAREAGHLTRFPSLELTGDTGRYSGACDSGYACAYQHNLSWSSPTTPLSAEANPRLVFERLFGTGAAGERAASLERRQREQRSILDFILTDARSMQRRLNAPDRDKLDQYLTGIREIETRIARAERFGKPRDPGVETPPGIPTDYGEHLELMFDMLVLAFQTDSTRIATMLLAHDGSNRSFSHIGIPEGHHDLSHHFNDPEKIRKVADIDRWYAQQFAKFLDKMEATRDVDGHSLLHNSMIVYGGGNADANRHTHSNLPIVLAGGGGGTLTPGRYQKHQGKPMSNLFLSLADRMGVSSLKQFGDSNGRLETV